MRTGGGRDQLVGWREGKIGPEGNARDKGQSCKLDSEAGGTYSVKHK